MNSRAPYRKQAEVRSVAADPTVWEQLAAPIALTQLLVLDLCVVRTAADLLRGSMSIEGGIALALAVTLVVSLVRAWLRSRRRRVRGEGDACGSS